tara:strand:+ start:1027 stop:2187 length:1161 start_codon:yes stop_codon:yes gene_type:complete
MSIADGSQHRLSYEFETVYGTTKTSPTLKPFRHTGTSLGLEKSEIRSQELSTGRQFEFVRHGNKSVGNDVNFELSYGSQDDWMEAALCGTWTTKVTTGELKINPSSGALTRVVGSFITDGFAVGDVVTSLGQASAGNNGRFVVTAVTALALSVTPIEGQSMSSATGSTLEEVVVESTVMNGVTRRFATFERYFADQGTYVFMTGLNASSLSLSIAPDAVVTGSLSLVGKDILPAATSAKAGSTYPAATTTEPFDSFTGSIREDGALIAAIQSIDFNCDNSMDRRFVVFDDTSLLPSIRKFNLSGTVSAYFDSITLYNKFISETSSSLQFELIDNDGNAYWVYMPNIKYMSGNPDVSDDGSVTISMAFAAVKDTATGKTLIIQRTPV